ncbi:hypothetical protein [Methylobacterium sp. SI9]|uniref:hypothetical protein n=1 Tax=Methylobacterium guangdongense TaxID=3138811 RepID=UPI00313C6F5B
MRNTIDPAFAEQIGMTMTGHRHVDTVVLSAAAEAVLASYEPRATSYSRNRNFYTGRGAIDLAFTHEAVTRGIDHLAGLGLIDTNLGNFRSNGTGKQSTFWATPQLLDVSSKAPRILRRQTDCIIQKDKLKRPEPYARTRNILALRDDTMAWTESVHAADIGLADEAVTWTADGRVEIPNVTTTGASIYIHTGDFAFYRVFNNSSLKQGGRAYGHWSQNLPGSWRRKILIDGEVVALLDFSAAHPRMVYALAGIPYPANWDPYTVPGIDRETAKLAFLIVLNAVSHKQGVEAMAGKLAGADQPITAEHQQAARAILKAMEQAHEPIRSQFYKGTGLQCQFVEAMILSEVAKEARRENIVTLPVHDELIVQERYAGRVHELMVKHWHEQIRKQFGAAAAVDPVIK